MANEIPSQREMLPYVRAQAERMDAMANRRATFHQPRVRNAAASLMAQRLWALVDDLEANKPVMIFVNES